MNPDIELISVGTELLNGRTLNRHAQTLGAALSAAGLRLVRDTTVPDESTAIQSAVQEALKRVDLAVVSGGLGPTCDDITRDALAELFHRRIVSSPEAADSLQKRYAARNRTVTPAAERQAFILEGAAVLHNSAGIAPGERVSLPAGKFLFIVPGPPNEFAAVLEEQILPWLRQTFAGLRPYGIRILTVEGMGESDIVTLLESAGFQAGDAAVGFYPGQGRVEIRLSAPSGYTAALDAADCFLRKVLGGYLVETGAETP